VDGHPIGSDDDLVRYVSERPPGTLAALSLWRDGRQREVAVKLRDRPIPEAVRRRAPGGAGLTESRPAPRDRAPLGLTVRELDPQTRQRRRVPDAVEGVLITDVDAAGPARLTRIRTNQILLDINRQPIRSVAAYEAALGRLVPGEAAVLLVYNTITGERSLTVVVLDPA
jgi:serine protease Do